uniref:Radial spoke head protein 4 homolog A n=1 Tax=Clastoptera arizonana TaxID=38151 RepID=A0A1B6CW71_9HEMI
MESEHSLSYLGSLEQKESKKSTLTKDFDSMQGDNFSIKEKYDNINKNLPNLEHDINQGILFLKQKGNNNLSVWSHLNEILRKLLSEKPENVIDYFEEYSRQIKQDRYVQQYGYIQNVFIQPDQLEYSKKLLELLKEIKLYDEESTDIINEEEDTTQRFNKRKNDLIEVFWYFSQGNINLPDTELFAINISMKKLMKDNSLHNPRFWGKVFGLKSNYFILECELSFEEITKRNQENEEDTLLKEENSKLREEESIKLQQELETNAIIEEVNTWLAMEQEEYTLREKSTVEDINEDITNINVEEEIFNEEIKNEDEEGELHSSSEVNNVGSTSSRSEANIDHFVNENIDEGTDEALPERKEEETNQQLSLLPPLPSPKKILSFKIPLTLKPILKIKKTIPTEKFGEGVNKKVFFVCSDPGAEWTELPMATPQEICIARQLKIYFTGNLDAEIDSYPMFPGKEMNYLRAQIARISASTQISPLGFYSFKIRNEEEEEEEEEEDEEVEEEEDGKKSKEYDKEIGPQLLTSLSEDVLLDGNPTWKVSKSSYYNEAIAIAKSSLWPGAYAFAIDKKFDNVYIGDGHKNSSNRFFPTALPYPEYEYQLGPEIMEVVDPSVELEENWQEQHKKKPPPKPEEEEEEEAEEEEEEEDDEDD